MSDRITDSPTLSARIDAAVSVRIFITVLLLVAFALRLYHLDFQSLEGDEGISLQRSSQPLGQMLERMPVEHVPGYFVLLNGWLRLAGEHDFALRYLSVWPSVVAVALVYRWAASMGRPVTGLIAALLLATNAFQVWYAQQARMYSWLLMTSLFSYWSLWQMVTPETIAGDGVALGTASLPASGRRAARWRADILYILSTTATIYLHYFGFLVPVAQTVFMAIWSLGRGRWRITRRWIVDGIAVFLLFTPWLRSVIAFLGFQGWREPLDPWQVPWMMHSAYSVGFPMPQPWQKWLSGFYLLMVLLGFVVWWRQNRSAWGMLAAATLVPFALIFIAVLRSPDFHERYSMFIAAPWLVVIAAGFAVLIPQGSARGVEGGGMSNRALLSRLMPALLVVGLVAANGSALNRLYFDTTLHKPDYHSAAIRIQANEAPGDVVLVDGPNPELVFNHYYYDTYYGQAPVYDLRFLGDAGYEKVDGPLQEFTAGANRAWELLYFRAPGPIQLWMATHAWSSAPTDHNGIRVTLYGLDRGPLVEQEIELPFGPGLTLERAAVEGPVVKAADLLRVTTRWQVDAPLPEYKFSLRLLTAESQVVLADDYVPQNWFAPTSQWLVGTDAVDQRALFLPADLPPGSYLVTLRLYDPTNGVPVETTVGQDVQLGTVEVR
jgi:mannosyltransferase